MEVDLFGLDLTILDIDLVSAEHDGDSLAHPHNVPVPVGHVFVCHACSHVEHDDRAVALDVIACTCKGREHEMKRAGAGSNKVWVSACNKAAQNRDRITNQLLCRMWSVRVNCMFRM